MWLWNLDIQTDVIRRIKDSVVEISEMHSRMHFIGPWKKW